MKNDHIAFQVSNIDAAISFYTEKIGLRLLSRAEDPVHQEIFAFLELEGGNLELLQKINTPYEKPALSSSYCPHLALAVENLSEFYGRLVAQGITILAGPMEIPNEVKWLYISDPDNNVIEFVQWLAKA